MHAYASKTLEAGCALQKYEIGCFAALRLQPTMAMSFIFRSMALLQLGPLALNEDAIACVRVQVDRDRRKDTRARVHGWCLGFFPSPV